MGTSLSDTPLQNQPVSKQGRAEADECSEAVRSGSSSMPQEKKKTHKHFSIVSLKGKVATNKTELTHLFSLSRMGKKLEDKQHA